MAFLRKFVHGVTSYSVVIEDDDKVCYAYLIRDDHIVGDVWLCNRVPSPKVPEWKDRKNAPFLNPADYSLDPPCIKLPHDGNGLDVSWTPESDETMEVDVHCGGRILARLRHGFKPGWSANAVKDGPLAKALGAESGNDIMP
jgi:hypothetical protein